MNAACFHLRCAYFINRKKRDEGKRSRGKKRRQEQHRGREKQGRQGVRRKELVSYGLLWEVGKAYWSLFHYRKGTVFEL